jgi:hypothetical protein
MGLQKSLKIKGFDCEYHIIHGINIDYIANQAIITVANYKDKSTRDISKRNCFPVKDIIRINISDMKTINGDIRNKIYTEIKKSKMQTVDLEGKTLSEPIELNKYANAEDILEV